MHRTRNYSERQRRPRRPRFWMRRVALLLLLLAPLVAYKAWSFFTDLPLTAEGDAPPVPPQEPVYVLVLGVDEREDDIGRSDTLLLVRLAREADRVDVINIPRDTRISLPDGSSAKINITYPLGGSARTVEAVAQLLDIPQPYYVTVNFDGFTRIVDRLGGIEMTVDRDYYYEDPFQNLLIDIRAGTQVMDGETALKYVRLRYDGVTNSDIARIERQQQFLAAVQKQILQQFWAVPDLVSIAKGALRTNVPEKDQLSLGVQLLEARKQVHMLTLPGEADDDSGDWIFDQSMWQEVIETWPIR